MPKYNVDIDKVLVNYIPEKDKRMGGGSISIRESVQKDH